jgi:hypothetical protein
VSPQEGVVVIGIIFGNLVFIFLIVAWWRMRQRRFELQAELQSKLIDKFGSTPELITFLQSSAGRQFVHGVQTGASAVTQERVLAGIRKAIVMSFLGLGLLSIWLVTGAGWVSWFGLLFLFLGVGFLVAAFVSMRLSHDPADAVVAAPARSEESTTLVP